MLADIADLLSKLPPLVQVAIGIPAALAGVYFFFLGKREKEKQSAAPLLDVPRHHFDGPMTAALELFERLVEATETHDKWEEQLRAQKKLIMDRVEHMHADHEKRLRDTETAVARLEGWRRPRS